MTSTALYCSGCKSEKPRSKFYKKRNARGRSFTCVECELEKKRDYYSKNRDQVLVRVKFHTLQNKEARRKYDVQYFLDHREEKRTYKREYMRKRLADDQGFRLMQLLRDRVRKALKRGAKKATKTSALIGCSMLDLQAHLENQFKPGMTWSNQGRGGWSIDHIRPCSSFDLTDPEQQLKCFHFTNLQPLWELENQIKSNTWEGDGSN